jgi:chromosome segregation ATPase
MSESTNRSWDEAVDALRKAARDLHAAVTEPSDAGPETQAAAERLKTDVSRLERSAADLMAKFSSGMKQQRPGIESSFDRERAERNAGQLKTSLEDLAALAGTLATDLAAAAKTSIDQSEPQLQQATRALDDVVRSAAEWFRSVVDPERDHQGNLPSEGKPPLDDL